MAKLEAPTPENDWEVQDALNTLLKAEEIKQDKKLMNKIAPLLEKKEKGIQKIRSMADLKDAYNKSIEDEAKEDGGEEEEKED